MKRKYKKGQRLYHVNKRQISIWEVVDVCGGGQYVTNVFHYSEGRWGPHQNYFCHTLSSEEELEAYAENGSVPWGAFCLHIVAVFGKSGDQIIRKYLQTMRKALKGMVESRRKNRAPQIEIRMLLDEIAEIEKEIVDRGGKIRKKYSA